MVKGFVIGRTPFALHACAREWER